MSLHVQAPCKDPPAAAAAKHVEAELGYVLPGAGKPAVTVDGSGKRLERNFTADPRRVRVANGWLMPAPALDREGFALVRHETALQDFTGAIEPLYCEEMQALLRQETGADEVVVFDHNLRRDDGGADGSRRPPVRRIHNDFTARSGPRRVAGLLGDGIRRWRRVALVNVWRPIVEPVETAPLALADARSVAPEDLIAADLVYPDRTGEIYYAAHSSRHRWRYYPQMGREEALLIKGYDSLEDGRARWALHTAFDDPTSRAGAAPRESIEVRAAVLFA